MTTNVEIVTGLYEALGRGDIAAVQGLMDAAIHWHEAEGNPYMPSGKAWVGADAIIGNLFVKLGEEWNGFAVHPAAFHDAGDVVVVEGRYTGQYKATGKSLDAQLCHVWTLDNGKVVKFQQYVDTAQFRDVMGA